MWIYICIFASTNILKNDMQDIAFKIKQSIELNKIAKMKKLVIVGYGSDLHLKNREDDYYEESYYFLNDIETVNIDGEEVDYEKIEIDDVLTHFGYKRGETTIKYVLDEDTNDFFEFEFEYELPDSDEYQIKIKHVENDDILGELWLVDVVEVNGEEIESIETPDYYGDRVEYDV